MGLRIGSNLAAFNALHSLQAQDSSLYKNIHRLSTGKRIAYAADDPAGVVASTELKAHIASLKKVITAAENGNNILGLAEQSLGTISTQLEDIRASIIAAQSGSSDQTIEQGRIDAAIANIDRIANQTRFGNDQLLNGSKSIVDQGTGTISQYTNDLRIDTVDFKGGNTRTVSLNFTSAGATAGSFATGSIQLTSNIGSQAVTVRITGNRGTADVVLVNSAAQSVYVDAINDVFDLTGVTATGRAGSIGLHSEFGGTGQFVSLEVVGGTGFDIDVNNTNITTIGNKAIDYGESVSIEINGKRYTPDSSEWAISDPEFGGKLSFVTNTLLDGNTGTIDLENKGFTFLLSDSVGTPALTFGIDSMNSSNLGRTHLTVGSDTHYGYLGSLKTGSDNALDSDIENALRIVDEAITQVAKARGRLGSLQDSFFEPTIDSTWVTVDNMTSANSAIEDLDFAEEITDFTKNQVMFQAASSVLASANTLPGVVLSLLGGI